MRGISLSALMVGAVLVTAGERDAGAATPEREVLVVNPAASPVNVQGHTTVSGTVACSQAAPYQVFGSVSAVLLGTPTVTLEGSPMVSVAPKLTATALFREATIPVDGFLTLNIPTAEYEEIRVVVQSECAACNLSVRYFIGTSLIDEQTIEAARIATRLFRVPGTSFLIETSNPGGGAPADVTIAVYGRP